MLEEIYTTTFADVEQTAEEFGRIALHLPERQMAIVLDDTLIGKGYIKQFDDTPYGLTLARRWAVRMDEDDEKSDQPFDELRAEYLAAIGED